MANIRWTQEERQTIALEVAAKLSESPAQNVLYLVKGAVKGLPEDRQRSIISLSQIPDIIALIAELIGGTLPEKPKSDFERPKSEPEWVTSIQTSLQAIHDKLDGRSEVTLTSILTQVEVFLSKPGAAAELKVILPLVTKKILNSIGS